MRCCSMRIATHYTHFFSLHPFRTAIASATYLNIVSNLKALANNQALNTVNIKALNRLKNPELYGASTPALNGANPAFHPALNGANPAFHPALNGWNKALHRGSKQTGSSVLKVGSEVAVKGWRMWRGCVG